MASGHVISRRWVWLVGGIYGYGYHVRGGQLPELSPYVDDNSGMDPPRVIILSAGPTSFMSLRTVAMPRLHKSFPCHSSLCMRTRVCVHRSCCSENEAPNAYNNI